MFSYLKVRQAGDAPESCLGSAHGSNEETGNNCCYGTADVVSAIQAVRAGVAERRIDKHFHTRHRTMTDVTFALVEFSEGKTIIISYQ